MKSAFALVGLFTLVSATVDDDSASQERASEPYVLTTCPMSGEELGARSESVVVVDRGRELELCCAHCAENLEANADEVHAAADAAMAADQRPFYPLDTCIISGEPLTQEGEDVGRDVVVKNRLFRVCCEHCEGLVRGEGMEAAFERLDAAVVEAQRPEYPLEMCAVNKRGALGSMGEPTEQIVANRLVRFCCANCEPRFLRNPRRYLPAVDEAWAPIHARASEAEGEDG